MPATAMVQTVSLLAECTGLIAGKRAPTLRTVKESGIADYPISSSTRHQAAGTAETPNRPTTSASPTNQIRERKVGRSAR